PLNFFLLAAALALAPIGEGKPLSLRRWLAAGLLTGLAALSKYHAIFFAADLFLYMLVTPERRSQLLTPGPWFAALAALIVFSPVLLWNVEHHWVSLGFQGGRAQSHHFGPGLFLSLLLAQLALITPWVAFPLLRGIANTMTGGDPRVRFVLWLGLPIALFFSFVPLWSDGGMVQWAMPGWLLLLPLAGRYLAEQSAHKKWPGLWAAGSAALFVIVAALFCGEVQKAWLGDALPGIFRRGDPTAENYEWRMLASQVNKRSVADSRRDFILSSGWRDASKIDQGLDGRYRVLVSGDDPRNFAVAADDRDFQGRDGWIVLRAGVSPTQRAAILNCFSRISRPSAISLARGARPDAELVVWRGQGYLPGRCDVQRMD
ncbi:MAG TPA: glycosyltransferase family 39 protein, partial [Rhizomicrobium sp.]|nr:glycosyltransferase family 39 protein [Rhizomicrobium sp.]